MPPKVPRLRWDDPLRALDVLGSLWSSTGLPSVTAGAAQAVAVPYRTLFTTLQQLLVGKRVTIRMGDHDVTLTVTELDSELEPGGLTVGQLGEIRVAASEIEWADQYLQHAEAVLRNVHIRPGVPPLVIAAPVELSTELPAKVFDDMLRQAAPRLHAQLNADSTAQLRWARRPGLGSLEVDVDVVGTTLWVRPRALLTGQRGDGNCRGGLPPTRCRCPTSRTGCWSPMWPWKRIRCRSRLCCRNGGWTCHCGIWKTSSAS